MRQPGVPPDRTTEIFNEVRLLAVLLSPKHDFQKDSIQRRILDYFVRDSGKYQEADNAFIKQEHARLFCGFQAACERAFGGTWRKHTESLENLYELQQLELYWYAPDLLGSRQDMLTRALYRRDAEFIKRAASIIEKGKKSLSKGIPPETTSLILPKLDIGEELCRYWTNPDFPLWLMSDTAFKQAIQYLTAGQLIYGRTIQKRIERMKLKRFERRPIRKIILRKEALGRQTLTGYEFDAIIAEKMKDVPLRPAYGQTGIWKGGRT